MYQDYSNSELEWLDAVPSHWELHRNKYLFREVNERTETGDETLFSLTKERGLIDRSEVTDREAMASTLEGYKVCRPGDLVMNRMQAWNGMFGFAEEVGLVSPDYSVYRPSDHVNSRYYEYLFSTPLYIDAFQRRSKGVGSGFLRLYTPDFHDIRAIVPPRSEQDAIANYLDVKTADIDAYVAKKRELVDLLETQRRAVVNRAVTTGLDDDVEMRDSGVEWLGEIPAHWDVTPLKRLSDLIQSGPFGSQLKSNEYIEGGVPVINPTNISGLRLGSDNERTVTEEKADRLSRHKLSPGDLLFARRGKLGTCALVGENNRGWLCGTGCARVNLNEDMLHPNFAVLYLSAGFIADWLEIESIGATMSNINSTIIGRIPVVVPPLDEQKRIVDHIDAQTADIDAAIERTERQIGLMQQYRTSLVTEVVTGAVDVRAEVAA
jgi:type I restriction enzyme S subunit